MVMCVGIPRLNTWKGTHSHTIYSQNINQEICIEVKYIFSQIVTILLTANVRFFYNC